MPLSNGISFRSSHFNKSSQHHILIDSYSLVSVSFAYACMTYSITICIKKYVFLIMYDPTAQKSTDFDVLKLSCVSFCFFVESTKQPSMRRRLSQNIDFFPWDIKKQKIDSNAFRILWTTITKSIIKHFEYCSAKSSKKSLGKLKKSQQKLLLIQKKRKHNRSKTKQTKETAIPDCSSPEQMFSGDLFIQMVILIL